MTYTSQNDLCYIKSVQDMRFMTERVRDMKGKCAAPKRSVARNTPTVDMEGRPCSIVCVRSRKLCDSIKGDGHARNAWV